MTYKTPNSDWKMQAALKCREFDGAFKDRGIEVIRNFIDPSAYFTHLLSRLESEAALAQGDPRYAPHSLAFYNDPKVHALHLEVLPLAEQMTGYRLAPTFSMIRLYEESSLLRLHRDRPACEVSLSIHLGRKDAKNWELCFLDPDERFVEIFQEPGDAVLFLGCERWHWRPRYQGSGFAQLFLNYVNLDGPRKAYAYDKNCGTTVNHPNIFRIAHLIPGSIRNPLKHLLRTVLRYL